MTREGPTAHAAGMVEEQLGGFQGVVDTHIDTLLRVAGDGIDLGSRLADGHIDLLRLAEGGVRAQFFACFIEPEYKPDRALARVLQLIDAFYRMAGANSDRVAVATGLAGVLAAYASGRLAAILAVEGGEAIGHDLAALRALYRLGVRCLGLTWNERNGIADGVGEESPGGLSRFGVEVVKEMNRLGMLIDVSHLAEPGFWDVLARSEAPVLASHSNARALCGHRRNLTDAQVRELAARGGVVSVNFCPSFVTDDPARATLDRVLDHVEHLAGVAGAGHVGIGSDFDGIPGTPEGLEDVSRLPALVEGLRRRGFREDEVRDVAGRNVLRLLARVVG